MLFCQPRSSVSFRINRPHLDTADSLALFDGDLDVALVSPACAPRVTDEPVLLSSLFAIADESNTVVEIGSTGSAVENASPVLLED